MKTIILTALTMFIFTANQAQAQDKARYTQNADEIETTKAWFNTYNMGEWAKISSFYAEGAEITHNNSGTLTPNDLVAGLQHTADQFSSYGIKLSGEEERVITDKGEMWVNAWFEFSGTFKDTGEEVKIPIHAAYQFEEGKILKEYAYYDYSDMLAARRNHNKHLIQQVYDGFSKGDIPTVLGLMDEQIVWNEAEGNKYAEGNPYVGPDAVLEGVFARLGADHEYFKVTDIQLQAMTDDKVLATLRYDAKLKKNQTEIDAQVAHLWTLKDGKVSAFQQYVDTRQLAEAEAAGSLPMIMTHNYYLPVSTKSNAAKAAYYKATQLGSNVRIAEANIHADKAIQIDPNFFMAYVFRIYYAGGDERAALIDKALALDTEHFNKAEKIIHEHLLAWDKDPDAKIAKNMKKLVAAYPNTPQAIHWAALHAAHTDKDKETALKYALKLAEMRPDFGPVYNSLGYLYLGEKEMDKAQKAFESYLTLCPNEPNSYDSMADYYMAKLEYTKAAEHYDKAAIMGMPAATDRAAKARASITR